MDLIAGKARCAAKRRTGLTLRTVVTAEMQSGAVAVIEVKRDTLAPEHGLTLGLATFPFQGWPRHSGSSKY